MQIETYDFSPSPLILDGPVIRHLDEGVPVVGGWKLPVSNPQGETVTPGVIRPDCFAKGSHSLSSKFATSGVVHPK
jgi:hypothetical protein